MATTPPYKKSKYIEDKFYEDLIDVKVDNRNTVDTWINQGDKYAGIIEAVQNAVDAPIDPYNDSNEIEITIPCLGDTEYGEVLMRIVDHGQKGLLKEYNNILEFLEAEKSISLKGDNDIGQNGQGMAQYQSISRTQRFTTRDHEQIYRFYMIPSINPKYRISFTRPEFHPISNKEWEKECGLFEPGTMVEWLDPIEDTKDLEPRKAVKGIQEIFGWRLMVADKTRIRLNAQIINLPDYLKARKKDLVNFGRMGIRTLNRNGIPKKVNPEITGFIVKNEDGIGDLVLHIKGYKILKESTGAAKQGTLYINCNQLGAVVTPNRKDINDEALKEDLMEYSRWIMRDLPDIKDDTKKSERKTAKNLQEILSKGLGKYLEKFMKHKNIEAKKKKKADKMIDPNGDDVAGYATYEHTEGPEIKICDLCGHRTTHKKSMRAKCSCKCHIPRPKGEPKNTNTVGLDELHTGRTEIDEDQDSNKSFNTHLVDKGPFIRLYSESNSVHINKKHKLYDFCVNDIGAKLAAERMAPYMAEIAFELDSPIDFKEKQGTEFLDCVHEYTLDILESVGAI